MFRGTGLHIANKKIRLRRMDKFNLYSWIIAHLRRNRRTTRANSSFRIIGRIDITCCCERRGYLRSIQGAISYTRNTFIGGYLGRIATSAHPFLCRIHGVQRTRRGKSAYIQLTTHCEHARTITCRVLLGHCLLERKGTIIDIIDRKHRTIHSNIGYIVYTTQIYNILNKTE